MSHETIEQASPASITRTARCLHGRLIDDILNNDGKRTGQVRCLECGAVFEDPYKGFK